MNTNRHRSLRGLGLAGLAGAVGLLCLAFATPADAGPRDRRDPYAGHAERGHERDHADRSGHADRDRRGVRRGHVDQRRHHDARRGVRVDARRHEHFHAPRLLHVQREADYRSYYRGRRYSRAHRHYHEVYDFPVLTRWGYEPRPHYYCEGNLFGDGYLAHDGPRIHVGVRF